MVPHLDSWARSTSRSTVRRGLIVGAIVLFVVLVVCIVLVVWNVSIRDLGLVALVTAPAGAIGLLLARDRVGWRVASEGGSLASGWEAFKLEIDRSRRHERPLALAATALPDQGTTGDSMAATIARARSQLRSIDVLWCDGSGLWVLMPESNRDGGTTAIRRIADATPAAGGAVWRLVVFPDDAITAGALIAELGRTVPLDLESRPTSSPAP